VDSFSKMLSITGWRIGYLIAHKSHMIKIRAIHDYIGLSAPYLFQLNNLVVWGMGWPLGIAAIAGTLASASGLVAGLLRPIRSPEQKARSRFAALWLRLRHWTSPTEHSGMLVLLGWAVPFFVYTAQLEVKFLRYMLPLAPVLCLLAARLLLQTRAFVAGRWSRDRRPAKVVRGALAWSPVAINLVPATADEIRHIECEMEVASVVLQNP